ncbi:MAG TPA: hypothetical protein VGN07_09385 [Steroidobacteraceae bacterium]|jgi:flagellar FliL protein
MKKSKLVIVVLLVGLLSISAGGAATWWMLKSRGGLAEAAHAPVANAEPVTDTRSFRYISLDKVIVMLRNTAGEPVSHYLAMDLVFMSPVKSEKVTREHLPLLRSVTVKALSELSMERASHLSVDELTGLINDAYTHTYASDREGKPFAEAMISKLIIE